MIASTEGDVGDSVLTLSIISQIPGGPHDLILRQSQVTKMKTPADVQRWHNIFAPLAESQPYLRECRIAGRGEHADWDSGGFRGSGLHSRSASLFYAQVSHLRRYKNLGHDYTPLAPWFSVEPSKDTEGRVIIARSGRYRNGAFPWQKVVDFYGDRLLFVGLQHEWSEFIGHYGIVERREVKDFLELAQLIAGSLLFIGNQSSPMTVCEGLKHRSIQETSTDPADCIYKRENAQYCYNGEVTLPGFDKEDLVLTRPGIDPDKVSTMTAPPGYWQYPGCDGRPTFESAFEIVCKIPQYRSIPRDELRRAIIKYNIDRNPSFFRTEYDYPNVRRALANAGY